MSSAYAVGLALLVIGESSGLYAVTTPLLMQTNRQGKFSGASL
jgi:hypothetical protein